MWGEGWPLDTEDRLALHTQVSNTVPCSAFAREKNETGEPPMKTDATDNEHIA